MVSDICSSVMARKPISIASKPFLVLFMVAHVQGSMDGNTTRLSIQAFIDGDGSNVSVKQCKFSVLTVN